MEQNKVKALYVHILEECERQSFTIGEFNLLVSKLRSSASIRNWELPDELPFIPKGKTTADYMRL